MDPSTVAFIKGALAFLVISGAAMTGIWLWFRLRATYRPESNTAIEALGEAQAERTPV